MKTKSEQLAVIWDELQDIFKDYKKLKMEHIDRLRKLGYEVVYQGKHPKIYIQINGKKECVTICSTPSDKYAGRQILRQIRALYERS